MSKILRGEAFKAASSQALSVIQQMSLSEDRKNALYLMVLISLKAGSTQTPPWPAILDAMPVKLRSTVVLETLKTDWTEFLELRAFSVLQAKTK